MGRYSGKTCRLLTMLSLTITYFLVEIVVGYITNSVALVADSFHMLSDTVALVIGLASIRISKWPSRSNTFGWVRAEILGALVNAVFMLALCFSILVESVKRMVILEVIEQPVLLLSVGVGGLVVNILGLFLFSSHVHGHSHKESKGRKKGARPKQKQEEDKGLIKMDVEAQETDIVIKYDRDAAGDKSSQQMNMMGVFLHVMGDALGSFVVIVSSLAIWLAKGKWRFYLDPAMSFAMVMLIFTTTIPLLKRTSLILLQTAPSFLDHDKLQQLLSNVEGVLGVHEFHVWQLTGKRVVLSAHIVCNNLREYMKVAAVVKDLFHKQGVHSTTIQPEFVEVTASQEELLQCMLPCVDKYRDCVPDTCCGRRLTSSSVDKVRKHRSVSKNTPRGPVTNSQSAPQQLALEGVHSSSSLQRTTLDSGTTDEMESGFAADSISTPSTGTPNTGLQPQSTGAHKCDLKYQSTRGPMSALDSQNTGRCMCGFESQSTGAPESKGRS